MSGYNTAGCFYCFSYYNETFESIYYAARVLVAKFEYAGHT